MEDFFSDMKNAIDTNPQTSPDKVKFYLDKFFNRFGQK
jgi:hypothetical protein